jgi:hypothetical protein
MRRWYRHDRRLARRADRLLRDLYGVFGWPTRLIAPLVGRYAHFMLKREEARLAEGWTYEPACFFEKNPAALLLEKEEAAAGRAGAGKVRPVLGEPRPA